MKDEIIDEIHKHREEIGKEFNYDVRALLEHFRKKQSESGRKTVSLVKGIKQSADKKKVA